MRCITSRPVIPHFFCPFLKIFTSDASKIVIGDCAGFCFEYFTHGRSILPGSVGI
jgi:hypothetical protein